MCYCSIQIGFILTMWLHLSRNHRRSPRWPGCWMVNTVAASWRLSIAEVVQGRYLTIIRATATFSSTKEYYKVWKFQLLPSNQPSQKQPSQYPPPWRSPHQKELTHPPQQLHAPLTSGNQSNRPFSSLPCQTPPHPHNHIDMHRHTITVCRNDMFVKLPQSFRSSIQLYQDTLTLLHSK